VLVIVDSEVPLSDIDLLKQHKPVLVITQVPSKVRPRAARFIVLLIDLVDTHVYYRAQVLADLTSTAGGRDVEGPHRARAAKSCEVQATSPRHTGTSLSAIAVQCERTLIALHRPSSFPPTRRTWCRNTSPRVTPPAT
jgi:hypothetical protein